MIDLLGKILCAVKAIPALVIDLLVMAINGWILLIGSIVQAGISVLPDLPDVPTFELGEAGVWLGYFIPFGPILAYLLLALGWWVVWLGLTFIVKRALQ